MIGFHFNRSISTDLKLNGPTLAYSLDPVDATESITGIATFSGIATASYPPTSGDIVEGTYEFNWYLNNDKVTNDTTGVSIVTSYDTTTLTLSNIDGSYDGASVYLITNYLPGTNEGNAINDNLRSDSGTLTLIPDIEITQQPQSVLVAAGNDAVFEVEAQLDNGVQSELFYQWYVNGQVQTDTTVSGYTYSGTQTDTLTVTVGDNVAIGDPAICISVIDESSPDESIIEDGWNSFRANYPERPFWLLQPSGYEPDRLKMPQSYIDDPIAYYPQEVNRDNGSTGSTSDWFNMCNLSQASPGTSISISIDNSGSTTTAQVQASFDLFLDKCEDAGLVVYQVDMEGEQWAPSHNRDLPESSNAPDQNIYCEVSNPQSFNSPLNSNTVTMSVVAPRPILKFESYTFANLYQNSDVNLSAGSFTLTKDTFGSDYSIIQFHSTEKDNTITLDLYGSKGNDNGSYNGGNGGYSQISFNAERSIEYTLIGISDNSSIFLYRGSNLIAVIGEGGDAGNAGDGGDGGGINIPGSDGGGRLGGDGGERIADGTLSLNGTYGSIYEFSSIDLIPGDSVAGAPNGGRTISCTKGSYWIDQGISACSNNSSSNIKFVNVDGTTIDGSSSIIRGFKPGYTISNTSGLEINNGGRGGNGAQGGQGGTSGGGGGGGSGYSDGSVTVNESVLGGNTGSSYVTFRLGS